MIHLFDKSKVKMYGIVMIQSQWLVDPKHLSLGQKFSLVVTFGGRYLPYHKDKSTCKLQEWNSN